MKLKDLMPKRAFTMSEVLVTIVIIGVLAVILVPIIKHIVPNKSQMMFKKAYYVTETSISSLINDNGLYPDDAVNPGFANTAAVTVNGVVYNNPALKFCQAFASKANISGPVDCTKPFNFTTNDGIVWSLPTGSFSTASSQVITVDVVGGTTIKTKDSPNCFYDASTCTNPDQFHINIFNDGKILLTDAKEMEYLNVKQPSTGCIGEQHIVNGICIDPPCSHGGTVTNGLCTCASGYDDIGGDCYVKCTGNYVRSGTTCVCGLSCSHGGSPNGSCTTCTGCSGNWGGTTCDTCGLSCSHSGTQNAACTSCNCTGSWTGTTCDTCGYTCYNGGSPNASCNGCNCTGYWTGSTCSGCGYTCYNGGSSNGSCNGCNCSGNWTGSDCSSCGLGCSGHGSVNGSCSGCNCTGNWTGSDCSSCGLSCSGHGSVNGSCTSCSCSGNWSGSDCSYCGLSCGHGSANGSCSGCNCSGNWTGSDCNNCSLSCSNGGSANGSCTSCSCTGNWGGSNCTTCNLSCSNGGTPNGSCTSCNCPGNWTGSNCNTCSLTCNNGGSVKSDCSGCNCTGSWTGSTCTTCNLTCPGQSTPNGSCSACVDPPCSGGYHLNTSTHTCEQCVGNQTWDSGSNSCVDPPCPGGTVTNGICTCPANQHWSTARGGCYYDCNTTNYPNNGDYAYTGYNFAIDICNCTDQAKVVCAYTAGYYNSSTNSCNGYGKMEFCLPAGSTCPAGSNVENVGDASHSMPCCFKLHFNGTGSC